MIRDVKMLEEFEKELVRSEKADFMKNLKIVSELHQEALKLGVFKKHVPDGASEVSLRIAKVVNSVRKAS